MDTKDIVIAVLVISLVFVVGLVFGQRKNRNSSQQNTDQVSTDFVMKKAHPKSKEAESSLNPKPLKDYSREFEFLANFHNRFIKLLPKIYEGHCHEAFDEQFQIINEAYDVFSLERNEHSSDEVHKLISTILPGISFGNVVSQTQKKSDLIANEILSGYQSEIDGIFMGKEFERLSNKYRLGSDLKAEQLRKISLVIFGKFNAVFLKTREFDQRREWLLSNYGNLVKVTNVDADWGSFAKHFAGGALAVANPIIGIPLIVASWFGESDKDKQQQSFVERYGQEWDEFESMIEPLRQEIIDATANVSEYLLAKYDELFKGVIVMLKETAAAGHSLDHYFENIKKTELPAILNLEKELA